MHQGDELVVVLCNRTGLCSRGGLYGGLVSVVEVVSMEGLVSVVYVGT